MKRLYMPAFAAVVWASAVAGAWSAEPAVKYKLELVRLEPLDTSKTGWKELFAYHCIDSQSFHRLTEKGRSVSGSEGNFRKVVQKEPARYHAEHPLRGVAKLGSKEYGFVLDNKDEKSKGYDRLYFDLNGNGDLTDDRPIDALPNTDRSSSATFDKSEFPRVDLTIDVDGKRLAYSFFVIRDYYHRPDYEYVTLYLTAAVYRRGEVTLNGRKHEIAVLDWNSNGRFDDVVSVPKNFATSSERIVPKCGDMLLIDPENLAKEDLSWSRPAGDHRQFLGKLTAFENKCYEVKVSPLGDELTWTPSPVQFGQVASSHASCRVDLISDLGYIELNLEKSKPANVPAGQWRLLSYTTAIENWKDPEKRDETAKAKKDGKAAPAESLRGPANISRLLADSTTSSTPVTVKAGQTTALKVGPPYKTVVKAAQLPGTTDFSLVIQGADGEVVRELLVNGRRPDKPKLTITDPKGKVVAESDLEYG